MSQYPLPLPFAATHRSDDFIPSACNREAWLFIESWPQWPESGLLLYGPPACGKTHLAMMWAQRADAAIAETEQVGQTGSAEILRGKKALLLEQADNMKDEPAFFHLLNHLREQKAGLLLTANAPPALWPLQLPDLRSRLLAVHACAISSPDEALLTAVMRKQFSDRQLIVPDDVLAYLLARMERSFAAASALVERLDRAALAQQRAITLPLARKVLEEEADFA